ncbi:RecB family exonuclease [Jatrophihabitans fulvus]
MTQLSFGDMPQPLFAATPARLAAYECPRAYRFRYVDRPAPATLPWARSTVGAVAHVALYRWWHLPRSQRVPERGVELVEQNWTPAGFRDERQSARACELVADWVSDYLAQVDPAHEPIGVERTVATRTGSLALSGRVDRIDERDGGPVIVDYKTGSRTPTAADAAQSSALALYAVCASRTLRRDVRRVELHHLPTGTVATHEHDDASLAAHVTEAERTADAIRADRTWAPAPSPGCGWCDYRRLCPEGRAASEPRQTWDGLPARLA